MAAKKKDKKKKGSMGSGLLQTAADAAKKRAERQCASMGMKLNPKTGSCE